MFNFIHIYEFSNDKIGGGENTFYIQTNTAYFCFTVSFNPFPVQFKSLVPGQKSRVFSRGI